ncbi:serine/threonine protein kinase [Mycobacterium talmoniae]|uniref:Serine/threonine protein kinase n=1 Tax=Mycobacterium talmoniae TaxID=1858794 RepID=A0A1S1NCC6_9MYCO|nr:MULTISPECIES: serine/threonine protein kinase [Mycobacterium]OHV03038.1 serine/threonine protein kinase [Mycobacterium talmoniae]TDH50136.1 serine/threonine protein kinase [Mycobacterium eburneum]
MTAIAGLPYYEIDFNADGTLNTTTGHGDGGLPAAVAAGGITDLFVFAHGWNNGVDSARDLYQAMFTLLADQLGARVSSSAAVGVLWPSLLFPDDDPATAPPMPSSGSQLATALAPAFPDQQTHLDTLGQLLDDQPQDPAKLTEFHTLASDLVTTKPQGSEDTGEAALLAGPSTNTAAVLGHAAAMAPVGASNAQGLGNPFAGLWSGAREVLRTLSYYEMKNRAGVVGANGLGPLLAGLPGPPRIHLIGHSFGARLVSYALAGLPAGMTATASPIKSLTLIQGAFSHFCFAASLPFDPGRAGALAGRNARVDGPLLATFSSADRAVGWWYPAASMLARQDAEAAQDLVYRWGAMGHDGYQNEPAAEVTPLADAGKPYDFVPHGFYALDANAVIAANQSAFSGAHSDIRHPQIAWAIAAAAGCTP